MTSKHTRCSSFLSYFSISNFMPRRNSNSLIFVCYRTRIVSDGTAVDWGEEPVTFVSINHMFSLLLNSYRWSCEIRLTIPPRQQMSYHCHSRPTTCDTNYSPRLFFLKGKALRATPTSANCHNNFPITVSLIPLLHFSAKGKTQPQPDLGGRSSNLKQGN